MSGTIDTSAANPEDLHDLALQLAAQLPKNRDQSLLMLGLLEELIAWRYGANHAERVVLLKDRRYGSSAA
jgi:hypothetical protein